MARAHKEEHVAEWMKNPGRINRENYKQNQAIAANGQRIIGPWGNVNFGPLVYVCKPIVHVHIKALIKCSSLLNF